MLAKKCLSLFQSFLGQYLATNMLFSLFLVSCCIVHLRIMFQQHFHMKFISFIVKSIEMATKYQFQILPFLANQKKILVFTPGISVLRPEIEFQTLTVILDTSHLHFIFRDAKQGHPLVKKHNCCYRKFSDMQRLSPNYPLKM